MVWVSSISVLKDIPMSIRSFMLLFICFSLLIGMASPAQAAEIIVTTLSDNDGTCPGDTCSLRAAIQAAAPGDIIRVSVQGVIALNSEIVISKSLTINGGTNLTLDAGGEARIMTINAPDVMINNVRFINGSAETGGAIFVGADAVATLFNVELSGNTAVSGGAITVGRGTLILRRSRLFDNTATDVGGAIHSNQGTLNVINTSLRDNQVDGSDANTVGARGGAINLIGGTAALYRVTFLSNRVLVRAGDTPPEGAGLRLINGAVVTIANSTFSANRADDGSAGAVLVGSGELNLFHVTLAGNIQTDAALTVLDGIVRIQNSVFIGNTTDCRIASTVMVEGDNNLGRLPCPDARNEATGVVLIASDQGGDTPTNALLASSNAIDAADSCVYPPAFIGGVFGEAGAPLRVDQRGFVRPTGRACDLGAFESGAVPPTPVPTQAAVRLAPDRVLHVSAPAQNLRESVGGRIGEFVITLDRAPIQGEVITITPVFDAAQVNIEPTTRTLDNGNWETGRRFGIRVIDDTLREGAHQTVITFRVTSSDQRSPFNGAQPNNRVTVSIQDNE